MTESTEQKRILEVGDEVEYLGADIRWSETPGAEGVYPSIRIGAVGKIVFVVPEKHKTEYAKAMFPLTQAYVVYFHRGAPDLFMLDTEIRPVN